MADHLDLELAEQVRAATGTFVRRVRQGAGTPSDARMAALGQLERSGRSLTAAELARWRGVTHQTMRVLLAQMAKEGLIEGAQDPSDARALRFTITRHGLDLLAHARLARATWMAERWLCFLTIEEKDALRVALRAMARIADPDREDG